MKIKLKLNGLEHQEKAFFSDPGSLAPFCKPVVWNLGLFFDSYLKFEKQIYSVVFLNHFCPYVI